MKIANALLLLMLMVGVAQGAGNAEIIQGPYVHNQLAVRDLLKNCESQVDECNRILKGIYNDLSKSTTPDCTVKEIYEALKDLSSWVEPSTGYGSMTLEYRTPASQLRQEADRIERRDSAILKAREVLERCGKYFKN